MNDPLGLFGDEQSNDPLGLFGDDLFEEEPKKERSLAQKAAGAVETGLGMVAGVPSQIWGGLSGIGSLMIGEGAEKAAERSQQVQEFNFGAGQYRPSTEAGQEYTENVGNILNYPVEKAGDVGEFLGEKVGRGAAGRYLAELPVSFAMEMIEPTAIYGAARGVARRGVKANQPHSPVPESVPEALPESPVVPTTPEQLNLFDEFEQRSPISPYQTEMAPDMWRVDENGIPIRADLSMEVQNLQQPLQRNLWGDEVDVNFPRDPNRPLGPLEQGDLPGVERFSEPVRFPNDPENQIGITQAIDNMPEGIKNRVDGKFAAGTTRQSALDLLRDDIKASAELEIAKIDAHLQQWLRENDTPPASTSRGKSQRGGLLVGNNNVEIIPTDRGFEARVGDKVIGRLESNITPEQRAALGEDASVDIVKVDPEFKGKGVGRALYNAWSSVNKGNVIPSGKTSKDAWALWKRNYPEQVNKFVAQEQQRILAGAPANQVLSNITDPEIAQRVSSFNTRTRGQGGGLYLGNVDAIENKMTPSSDGTFIPDNPDVAKAIELAKKDGKDGSLWTYTQSGGTSAAMKTGSPIIKAVSEIVQNAVKRADLLIRNFVFPAEKSLKSLNKKELVDLGNIMKQEMFDNKRMDGDTLLQRLNVKQLEAYRNIRDLFDKTLDSQNAARVGMGKEPITAKEAYLSSRWQGDFRQPVYNQEGKLVWYLASHSKVGLSKQVSELQKLIPGLVVDPKKAHVSRSTKSGTDLQSAYSTMLDILGRDDPAIQKIQAAIQDQLAEESAMSLAQEKHFKNKGNTRGFAGDRPWMDRSKDTLDMFQQQLQYAKNAFKWTELQKVGNDVKAIVSDPELQETQPNNIKFIREYFKNAMGLGEAEVTRAVNDALRNGLGVSPHLIDKGIGNVKSFFILQKLAVSAGYTISNMIQAGNVLPYLADLAGKGIRGNPLTAIPAGFLGGMAMGTSHYLKAVGGEYVDKLPTQFFKDAFRYAEDNGVTARSVYDEAPLEASFSKVASVGNIAAKTMTIPETFVRSVAFMTYAQWLKDSGKFKDQTALFQKAEELTNMSMVDYRETERPMMFAKAGAAGNFLNTLQTYPFSFYNQWAYMLKEAARGNPAGLIGIAAFQFAVAGAMGIPGFDDADKLYKWIRDNALPTGVWNRVMKSEFFSDPKMWMIDNLGQGAVYGALSDQTGLGMTSRVAAPGAGAMLQSPLGPATDIAKQIGSVASAVMDPTNTTKVAQAAMNVAPVGLQGLLEQAPFMEGITYNTRPDGTKLFMKNSDLADRKGAYARTPEEQAVRDWGIRSQQEVLNRDVMWSTNSANQALTRKGSELIDQIYDASRRGNTERAKELATLYTDITGKELSNSALENQLKEEFYSDIEKNIDKSNTPRQLLNAARMQKLLNAK